MMKDDESSNPVLLLGTGADQFRTLDDGEISTLHRGCQGAQHLWVSLRLPQHPPKSYALELSLFNENQELVAPPFSLEDEEWLGYSDSNYGSQHQGSEIIGLTLVVFDPSRVVGTRALVRSVVMISEQVRVENEMWVEVQWGADAC